MCTIYIPRLARLESTFNDKWQWASLPLPATTAPLFKMSSLVPPQETNQKCTCVTFALTQVSLKPTIWFM